MRDSIYVVMMMLAVGQVAAAQSRFAVGIRLSVDPSISTRRITERLKTETAAIWEPYGVQIKWQDAIADGSDANVMSLDASVERQFKTPRRMPWEIVLGHVMVTPNAPGAANRNPIRVSFDATRAVLALRHNGFTAMAGLVLDQELARALGRVLAHEIGHVLLGPPFHDRVGLMRAVLNPGELAEADRAPFRLTCGNFDRLRVRLREISGAPLVRDVSSLGRCAGTPR